MALSPEQEKERFKTLTHDLGMTEGRGAILDAIRLADQRYTRKRSLKEYLRNTHTFFREQTDAWLESHVDSLVAITESADKTGNS